MAKQPEPRMTRTTRRLAGRDFEAFSDGVLQDPVTGHVERLTWGVTPKSRYDAAAFARSLFSRDENPLVYVDTSLFDARTSPRLWEALLSRPRGMTIIPIIRKELEPWLAKHPEHVAARAIRLGDIAVDVREYDTGSPEETVAFEYYGNCVPE